MKYKEAYEMVKAKAYTLHPEGVNFVNTRKANKIINEVRYSPAGEFLVTTLVIEAFLVTNIPTASLSGGLPQAKGQNPHNL